MPASSEASHPRAQPTARRHAQVQQGHVPSSGKNDWGVRRTAGRRPPPNNAFAHGGSNPATHGQRNPARNPATRRQRQTDRPDFASQQVGMRTKRGRSVESKTAPWRRDSRASSDLNVRDNWLYRACTRHSTPVRVPPVFPQTVDVAALLPLLASPPRLLRQAERLSNPRDNVTVAGVRRVGRRRCVSPAAVRRSAGPCGWSSSARTAGSRAARFRWRSCRAPRPPRVLWPPNASTISSGSPAWRAICL